MTDRAFIFPEAARRTAASLAVIALLLATPALAQGQPAEPDEQRSAVPAPPPDAALPQVEPIIDDAEFESAVPELAPQDDAELERELESIEEFERRLAAEVGQEGEEAPAGDPALADGDPTEEVADAPIRDAELTRPLPPLESFEVTPVEFAEAQSDAETASIAYKVEITGLEEADSESSAAMRSMFNGLSALRDGDGKAQNTAMIQARLEEDSQLMETILASEGWYSARVRTRIDLPTGKARMSSRWLP